ncbi:MAG: hypothetical protein WCX83_00975 [Candidatus Cloacimonas sp.]|nr:hypothetical protein [Candidatus Cloacimonadota bacterium]
MTGIEGKLIRKGVKLNEHSSFRIGGLAHHFSEPKNVEELLKVVQYCEKQSLKPIFFGYGSNLLFPDNPSIKHCYISLKLLNKLTLADDTLIALCGTPISYLSIIGSLADIDEFKFTYLLPGSVGAATYINARYFEQEMAQIIEKVSFIDLDNLAQGVQYISNADSKFAYKTSIFQEKNWLILETYISLRKVIEITDEIELVLRRLSAIDSHSIVNLPSFYDFFYNQKLALLSSCSPEWNTCFEEVEKQRAKYKHFDYPSAGSVFKNHRELGAPIGKIVDDLGLKGESVNGAMISPHHGNIIINKGGALASDVLSLVDKVATAIERDFGLRPVTEITIIE